MEFQYDSQKSISNKHKHGVSFEDAKTIWQGPYVEFPAKSEYENRFAIIGLIKNKRYTCIFCIRDNQIRLISCRRARTGEELLYEKHKQTKK